jgi:hypothetical protein
MSRNGTGTYNLPAGNPVVTGTVISSTWANNTLNDIASALTGSVATDGQTPMVGDLDMNTNKILNLDPGTVAGNAVEYDQFVNATTTAVAITGGTIDGTPIGNTTRSSGKFTTLAANAATTLTSTLDVTGVATFTANSAFNGTGALKIPAGTTAQQPTPVTGMIRYNSTTTLFEGYSASSWTSLGGGAAGLNTQVQYNNSGVLAGSSALTFNGTTLATTTLQSTNLSDGTNSTSTTNAIKGSAKAWVNFNGVTTATINASYNISSVTRNSNGDYTINFTNALANSYYTAAFGVTSTYDASYGTAGFYNTVLGGTSSPPTTMTTTQLRFVTCGKYSVAASQDSSVVTVTIFGT